MRRGWKIALGIAVILAALLALNTLVTNNQAKPAEANVPGGELLSLDGDDLQVIDRGPRDGDPIVLVHCFTCAIGWWDRMSPPLEHRHRVVAIDLLGHGGSEKPTSGYSVENQARLVADALTRLGVRDATVVGHSLGGPIAISLAEQAPRLVDRLVVIDSVPDRTYGDVGFIGEMLFAPVIGEALWRIKPDFAIADGLEVAFAPGFPVPDEFVEDVKRMTFSSYDGSHNGFDEYTDEKPLPQRAAATGKPVLAIMGAEEQIANDPEDALAAYADTGAQTILIEDAGHSPNVEKPILTANFVLDFAALQERVQKRRAVRNRP